MESSDSITLNNFQLTLTSDDRIHDLASHDYCCILLKNYTMFYRGQNWYLENDITPYK